MINIQEIAFPAIKDTILVTGNVQSLTLFAKQLINIITALTVIKVIILAMGYA
jgi:hypothetical protein